MFLCYERLEQESKILFNFSYFSDAIINGNWKIAEDYLSAFTSPEENTFSRKMFFELYKSKFSEAQDRQAIHFDDISWIKHLFKNRLFVSYSVFSNV